jgi:hypothetical protein
VVSISIVVEDGVSDPHHQPNQHHAGIACPEIVSASELGYGILPTGGELFSLRPKYQAGAGPFRQNGAVVIVDNPV